MLSDISIRRYQASDEDRVIDVWSRAVRRAHPFIPGEGDGERARTMREVYLIHAENWVAEQDDVIVGLLGMLGSEIGGLFVAPEAQGQGIGRLLVEHAVAMHGDLTLEVYERNTSARAVYDRLGFTVTDRRSDEETGHCLLAMHRIAVSD
ncbi:GNAT family N-acetyltransferase [Nocardia sp. NPDC050175]|uniref:GNAT family N-acetyltransferase n=1 Tax=Nocardia sp. NPDC050175 TaxID=3364317 RepID=UPI0037AC7B9D